MRESGAMKTPLAAYPALRLRRLRQADWTRRLVRESTLTPADFIWSTVVHGRSPDAFADVATMGPARRASARATVDAGTRTATLDPPARRDDGRVGAAGTTRVRGPGQKASARR